ncbi:protein kinase [Streptomyces sp. NPDC090075]|uniref:serine/threonine-protein kinase n=1 Tax=Streptomyces sp. NPDC090075 TaxID=3365937 RepID=UPI00382E6E00
MLNTADPESVGGYRLEARLGAGGMGVVYAARSESGRRVALKVVHQQYAEDPEFRVRFRHEVAAARRVSGAFTAAVVDADPDADRPWMATSYVAGPTLEQRVAQGPMSGRELRELAIGLAEALRDIHRVGVVHRDLKPSNVILSDEGPRVIDFGISRGADCRTLTATGRVLGTPPFMSPEQLVSPREAGPATDVFALASVLVYAASGVSPFEADTPYMTIYNVVHEQPRLGDLHTALRKVAEPCLAKEAKHRPSVDRLLDRLRAVPAEGYGGPGPAPAADGGSGSARGRLAWIAAGALLVTGAVVAGLVLAFGPPHERIDAAGRNGARALLNSSLPAGWKPWRVTLPSSGTGFERDFLEPPRRAGDRTCLASAKDIYCGGNGIALTRIDAATGKRLWKHPKSDTTAALIGVGRDGTVLAVVPKPRTNDSRLEGYDPRDGKRSWFVDIGNAHQADVFRDGSADFVLTQSWDGETFVAVNARTGEDRVVGRADKRLTCGPAVLDHRPYALCNPRSDGAYSYRTVVYAIGSEAGRFRKIADIPHEVTPVGTHRGTLVFVEYKDDSNVPVAVHHVNPGHGAPERVPLNDLTPDHAPLALIEGTLYFARLNGELSAVSCLTGKPMWTQRTLAAVSAPIAPPGKPGPLYFGSRGGLLLSLDPGDGKRRWRTRQPVETTGPYPDLALIGNALYTRYGYDQLSMTDVNHPV